MSEKLAKQDRTKPPKGYWVGPAGEFDWYEAYAVLGGEPIIEIQYVSEAHAIAACWEHRGTMVAEEHIRAEQLEGALRRALNHIDCGAVPTAVEILRAALAFQGETEPAIGPIREPSWDAVENLLRKLGYDPEEVMTAAIQHAATIAPQGKAGNT